MRTPVIWTMLLAAAGAAAWGQSILTRPSDDLPRAYKTQRDWAEVPGTGKRSADWPAAVTAVEPAPDGTIYVVYRCHENSCAGRPEDPILRYDKTGKLLKSWGAGLFVFPHGAGLDRDGNLWVTDAGGGKGIGHQAIKFSPDGRVLMRLGKAGVAGDGPDTFDQPTDVAIAPNGDIFVADGHRHGANNAGNNRIVHFSKEAKFIGTIGTKGSGPGQMREPHSIAFDSEGRLFVADRINNRIEIFRQDGTFIAQWTQFGRPSGLYVTKDDTLYVADSETGPDTGAGEITGWRKGIRIGSARDGKVTAFIEDMESQRADHSGAEGLGVDAEGNVYGAVVRRKMLEKHFPAR